MIMIEEPTPPEEEEEEVAAAEDSAPTPDSEPATDETPATTTKIDPTSDSEIDPFSLKGLSEKQVKELKQIEIDSHTQILKESGFSDELIEEFRERCKSLSSIEEIGILALGFTVDIDEINQIAGDKDLTDLEPDEVQQIAEVVTNKIGKDELQAMALLALGHIAEWGADSIQSSDLTRLLDAIIMGADYNSTAAMRSAYEAEGAEQITVDAFFEKFVQEPDKALEKMINISDEINTKLNWKGSDKLKEAANSDNKEQKKTALKDYFLEMYQIIAKASGAEHVLWERASTLIAKEVFGDKAVISLDVLKELEAISKDNKKAKQKFDL